MGLTDAEKAHLNDLLDRDLPLPPAYRARLFPARAPELVWPGKDDADPPTGPAPALRAVEHVEAALTPGAEAPTPLPMLGEGYDDGDDGDEGDEGDEGGSPLSQHWERGVGGVRAVVPPYPQPWRDRLIHGDAARVLAALTSPSWRERIEAAGGVRLAYLDPPFATGRVFPLDVPVGTGDPPRSLRLPAYRDPAGLAPYLSTLRAWLRALHALLADDGALYLHCDHRASAHLRLLLDEVFGPERFVNELVWRYGLGNAAGRRRFLRKHDVLLFYAKTDRYRFHPQRGAVTPAMAAKYCHQDAHGRYMLAYGRKRYLQGGKPLESVWDDIPALGPTAAERTGYPTQKPEALLERLILASTDPGDLVLDPCCGAGTAPAAAARLGRRWLAADASPLAVQTARRRLLARAAPFDLLALDPTEERGGDPDIAHPGGPPADSARVRASVHWDGLRATVTLDGYDAAPLAPSIPPARAARVTEDGRLIHLSHGRDGAATRRVLTEHWSDWVEEWAVGRRDPQTGAFRALWRATRTGRDRHLALASDPLPVAPRHTGGLVARVIDLFGQVATSPVQHEPACDPS